MTDIVVVGLQSGDEGKGKFADVLAQDAHAMVRWQGGPNTGHTVVLEGSEYKLVQVPAGVLRGAFGVLGNGCVVDPPVLLAELAALEARGVAGKLVISPLAHVIFPYHRAIDAAFDACRGSELAVSAGTGFRTGTGQVGSTKKGVGPCREDKIARIGVRMVDLLDADVLRSKLSVIVPLKRRLLEQCFNVSLEHASVESEIATLAEEYGGYARRLAPFVQDVSLFLADARKQGKRIVHEGAQGAALDIDFGTYPYVSSGTSGAAGVYAGTGTPPNTPLEVFGIVKAYMTQVGGGPLPTELSGSVADYVVERGREFGTVTGRRRRVGWLDLPFLRRAARLNGAQQICIGSLDVLAGLPEVQIATAYRVGGKELTEYPYDWPSAAALEPVYEKLAGWPALPRTSAAPTLEALPSQLRAYVDFVAQAIGVRVAGIGVGRGRNETLMLSAGTPC